MIYFRQEAICLDYQMIKKILRISIPNGIENGLFYLGRVLVVSIISGFATYQIAANGVANNLDTLGLLLGFAMNQATITVIGQCVGANDEKQVRYYAKKLIIILYVSAAILNLAILLFINPILDLYQVSNQTKALSKILVWLHNGSAILIWPIAFALPNVLRACNDVNYTMYISVFSMFSFRIGVGYLLGSVCGLGAIGVWLGLVFDWIFRTIMYGYRYLSNRWRKQAGFV